MFVALGEHVEVATPDDEERGGGERTERSGEEAVVLGLHLGSYRVC